MPFAYLVSASIAVIPVCKFRAIEGPLNFSDRPYAGSDNQLGGVCGRTVRSPEMHADNELWLLPDINIVICVVSFQKQALGHLHWHCTLARSR